MNSLTGTFEAVSINSGIGQCCACEFALSGCQKLFLVDLLLSKLENTKALIQKARPNSQVELYVGNISDELNVRGMIDRCTEIFGRLDIACNNAGVSGTSMRTHEATVETFDAVCAVNERGVLLAEKYEIQQMIKQDKGFGGQRGCIVNTASIAGHCIIPTASPYAASKHAVVAITRCDALRHVQDFIRINAVSPGAAWTPMLSESGLPKEFIELGASFSPMKRYLHPIEVANSILFLASPKSSGVTGINLPVDGGTVLLRSF